MLRWCSHVFDACNGFWDHSTQVLCWNSVFFFASVFIVILSERLHTYGTAFSNCSCVDALVEVWCIVIDIQNIYGHKDGFIDLFVTFKRIHLNVEEHKCCINCCYSKFLQLRGTEKTCYLKDVMVFFWPIQRFFQVEPSISRDPNVILTFSTEPKISHTCICCLKLKRERREFRKQVTSNIYYFSKFAVYTNKFFSKVCKKKSLFLFYTTCSSNITVQSNDWYLPILPEQSFLLIHSLLFLYLYNIESCRCWTISTGHFNRPEVFSIESCCF